MAGMQTSVTKTIINTKKYKNLGQQGFSLIEVLMALFLMFVVVSIVPLGTGGDDRSKLEDTLSKIERSVRFATNEAILRNKIVRIKFELEEDPITYTVEYGQSANVILPEALDLEKLSLREREDELKRLEKLDSQFIPVPEFESDKEPLPDAVQFIGLGTSSLEELVKENNAYIYFYPTGEKDSAIVILNTIEEIGYLKIYPFEERTKREFYVFKETDIDDIDRSIERKSKEIFEQWLKN